MTRDTYVQVTEKMFGAYPMPSDQSPDGLILHTAGETPEGFYIYDVWESKEHFQRVQRGPRSGPRCRRSSATLQPEGPPPEPQFYEIEVMAGPA